MRQVTWALETQLLGSWKQWVCRAWGWKWGYHHFSAGLSLSSNMIHIAAGHLGHTHTTVTTWPHWDNLKSMPPTCLCLIAPDTEIHQPRCSGGILCRCSPHLGLQNCFLDEPWRSLVGVFCVCREYSKSTFENPDVRTDVTQHLAWWKAPSPLPAAAMQLNDLHGKLSYYWGYEVLSWLHLYLVGNGWNPDPTDTVSNNPAMYCLCPPDLFILGTDFIPVC